MPSSTSDVARRAIIEYVNADLANIVRDRAPGCCALQEKRFELSTNNVGGPRTGQGAGDPS